MSIATMALKNLGRQKRRTVLLSGAIAFGLFVITLVNSLSGGLITALQTNISNLVAGHIMIMGTEKTEKGRVIMTIRDDAAIQTAVDQLKIPDSVVSKTTRVRQAGLISETNTVYQLLFGLDLGPSGYVHDRLSIVEGSLDEFTGSDSILISEGVAKKLDVKLGDRISVQAETVTGQQNVLDFFVRAIYKDPGVAATLAGAYADLPRVNELVNLGPKDFNVYGIYLKDVAQADYWGNLLFEKMKANEVALWPHTSNQTDIQNWLRDESWSGTKFLLQTLNDQLAFVRGLFDALNWAAFFVLLILFVVIMVGITNTYRMVVYERTREIGTLRALGMQRWQVRWLFIFEAIFLAVFGILAGFAVGIVALFGLTLVDLSSWKDFNILLQNNRIQLVINLGAFFVNFLAITALTAIAALFPANRAGNLTPAEALRSTN